MVGQPRCWAGGVCSSVPLIYPRMVPSLRTRWRRDSGIVLQSSYLCRQKRWPHAHETGFSSHHLHRVYTGRHTWGSSPHKIQPQIKISLPGTAFPTIAWSKLCVGCWNGTNLHLAIHCALQTPWSRRGRSLAVTASPSVTHWCHLGICSLEFDFPAWAAASARGVQWFTAERQWHSQ